jgi:hypothetical protein
MKKLLLLAIPVAAGTFAVSLLAADFWQSKPFTDWNDKDVQKMLQSSPWSKPFSVALAGGGNGSTAGRRAGGGNSGSSNPTAPMSGPAGTGDQGGLGRYKGGDPGAEGGASGVPTVNLTVRWQSAMPVREAIVKAKYGNEAGTSAEAKKALEEKVDHYILSVGGLPKAALQGDADELKKQMLAQSMLMIKGRDPIKPVDFITENGGRTTEVMFAFPKTAPISEEDKEVEFVVRIGEFNVRQKFRLKEMLVNGKLDL